MDIEELTEEITKKVARAVNKSIHDVHEEQLKRWFEEDANGVLVTKYKEFNFFDEFHVKLPIAGMEEPLGFELDKLNTSINSDIHIEVNEKKGSWLRRLVVNAFSGKEQHSEFTLDFSLKHVRPSDGMLAIYKCAAHEIRQIFKHINPSIEFHFISDGKEEDNG